MKKLPLIITSFLIASRLLAQDCAHYLYMQKNKTIEMTGYNKKGDVTMKSVSKVSEVKTANGITTANVTAEVFDKNGKSMGTSSVDYQCNGGVITMQMHVNTDKTKGNEMNINMSSTGDGGDFPKDMKVGDHLKDYTSQVMVGGNPSTVKVTDRQVLARESVTTTAGTFDCYKISYKSGISIGGGAKSSADSSSKPTSMFGKLGIKMPTINSQNTIWFAQDYGMIRSESKNGKMELTGLK